MFDDLGHALHFMIVGAQDASEGGGECGHFSAGPDYAAGRPSSAAAGRDEPASRRPIASAILGDTQPGHQPGTFTRSPTCGRPPRYDESVCPDGSTRLSICDPSISTAARNARRAGGGGGGPRRSARELAGARAHRRAPHASDSRTDEIQDDPRAAARRRPAAARGCRAVGLRDRAARPAAAPAPAAPPTSSSTSSSAHDAPRRQPPRCPDGDRPHPRRSRWPPRRRWSARSRP